MRRRTVAWPELPLRFQLLAPAPAPTPVISLRPRVEAASSWLCWPCGGHVYFFPFGQKGQPGRGRGGGGGKGEYATNSYSKHARKFLQFACIGNSLANRNWNHAGNGSAGAGAGGRERNAPNGNGSWKPKPNLSVIEWGSKTVQQRMA